MAKKIKIDIEVNGKMQKATVSTKKLRTALEGVDKSQKKVGESAQTTDRRIKGAAQASANGTKNFSKMAQGISGGLVPAYATLAAQIFAVSAVFQFLKDASDVSNLIAGQEALAATTGVAYKTISQGIKDATDGQLSYIEASKAAAIGTASGLSPSQLNDLGAAAKNASIVLGRDLVDSFNRLIRGVTKAEPELLDELGIILRLDPAIEKYKNALNITGRELTSFERTQAVTNEVLTQAERKFGAIEAIMDPSAASLNRFLVSFEELINVIKKDVIQILRPVFDFLSSNTTALTAALGLLALPIIKSILPSFKDMGDGAAASLKKQNQALERYEKQVNKAKLKTEEFGKTLAQRNADAIKTSKALLGPQPKSKKGGAGADFLLGTHDNATAKRNADKILTNAQRDIDNHGAVITGKLKGFNAQQVADLRASYNTRVATIKGNEKVHGVSIAKMKAHLKLYGLQVKSTFSAARVAVVGFAATAATAMATLSAAMGWIGLIALAASMMYELYRYLNPIPEEIRKAKEEMESFEEKIRGVNEELTKTVDLMGTNLLGVSEAVVASGNALNSTDLINSVIAFENLDRAIDPELYDKAKKELNNTFNIAAKLAPEIEELAAAFKESSSLTGDQKQSLSKVIEEYVTASTSIQGMTEALQNLDAAMLDVGATIQVSPFARLGAVAQTAADLSNSALPRMREQAKERIDTAFETIISASDPGRKGLKEAAEAAIKGAQKELDNFIVQNQYLNELALEYKKVQETIFSLEKAKSTANKDFAKNQTAGLTFADKIKNVENERLLIIPRAVKALNTQIAAQAAFNAASSVGDADRIAAAKVALQLATDELETLGYQLATEEEIRKRKIANLEFQAISTNLQEAKDLLTAQQSITREIEKQRTVEEQRRARANRNLENEMKDRLAQQERSPFGYIDKERRELQARIELETELIAQKEALIEQEIETKQKLIGMEYDLLENQFKLEKAKLDRLAKTSDDPEIRSSAQELSNTIGTDILGPGGALATNEAAALSEAEAGMRQALSDMIRNRDNLLLMKEDLTDINVLSDGVAKSFEEGMATAFTSILDGTAKAKDAFANMAKSILQYIIQMTVKMLIFRAISGLFGQPSGGIPTNVTNAGGGLTSAVDPTSFNIPAFSGSGRTGGIFSEGKKMPGYSAGGIARGSQAGYPAMLHGTEAVVPLPNGRSIPVQMSGAGQENNVTVNVAVDNQGASNTNTQSNGAQAEKLGVAISEAVKKELLNQKRVGGMLSPYGVA
jgi:hypothetical protein